MALIDNPITRLRDKAGIAGTSVLSDFLGLVEWFLGERIHDGPCIAARSPFYGQASTWRKEWSRILAQGLQDVLIG